MRYHAFETFWESAEQAAEFLGVSVEQARQLADEYPVYVSKVLSKEELDVLFEDDAED